MHSMQFADFMDSVEPMENNSDMLSACRIAGKLSTLENIANMYLNQEQWILWEISAKWDVPWDVPCMGN